MRASAEDKPRCAHSRLKNAARAKTMGISNQVRPARVRGQETDARPWAVEDKPMCTCERLRTSPLFQPT